MLSLDDLRDILQPIANHSKPAQPPINTSNPAAKGLRQVRANGFFLMSPVQKELISDIPRKQKKPQQSIPEISNLRH